MDNLLYVILTNSIVLTSFIVLIVVITICTVKKEFKVKNAILILFCLFGLYLYIPYHITAVGFLMMDNEMLALAKKLSVNPYEKRLCDLYIANNYSDFQSVQKDGNKAIEHYENALQKEYEKYKNETAMLAFLYSIKGDENKTLELSQYIEFSAPEIHIYLMNGEYKKALESIGNTKNKLKYLKADLYEQIGDYKNAKTSKEDNKPLSGEDERYKSIQNYKNWILKQKKEYKF